MTRVLAPSNEYSDIVHSLFTRAVDDGACTCLTPMTSQPSVDRNFPRFCVRAPCGSRHPGRIIYEGSVSTGFMVERRRAQHDLSEAAYPLGSKLSFPRAILRRKDSPGMPRRYANMARGFPHLEVLEPVHIVRDLFVRMDLPGNITDPVCVQTRASREVRQHAPSSTPARRRSSPPPHPSRRKRIWIRRLPEGGSRERALPHGPPRRTRASLPRRWWGSLLRAE